MLTCVPGRTGPAGSREWTLRTAVQSEQRSANSGGRQVSESKVDRRDSPVTTQFSIEDKGYFARPREVFIRLSLLTAMGVSCFVLMRPFLNLIVAGIIIAIGVYPGYRMLTKFLKGRKKLAATLCTILLLGVMIVPCVLLAGTLVDGGRG